MTAMKTLTTDRFIRQAQALALLGLPLLWMLMFLMHFRSVADFFVFQRHYVPVPAADTVAQLIATGNRWPMLHEPHMLGYLTLPLFALVAFGLYAVGRQVRPALAALGLSLAITGLIYVAGIFGLYTALLRGIGDVDARHTEGAIATFAAVTADHGAYGLTRTLAQLAMVGLAVQVAALWRAMGVPRWSPAMVGAGSTLFVAFWDVDNMMFLATLCLLAGFVPIAVLLWRRRFGAAADQANTQRQPS